MRGVSVSNVPEGETTLVNLSAALSYSQPLTHEERQVISALPPGAGLLIIRRGGYSGSRFLLDTQISIAGRHPASDIFLDDVTVSRRHAEFKRDGDIFRVVDLGSLNGTFVMQQRVDNAVLCDGFEVQIGKFHLTFFTSKALKG
ncbi:MAG: FHA domain-containing protein [Tropheryma whipplei]|uniref:FHA domain-containing protein n=1 Tax=Tropheryma whipplei (strain Twist) TaxID=203267 RepID=Q83GM7_TROWT|nr:FHA domain-containing protein [Tropheryma whipplei]AAO44331.1 unknown [Tropheryma whipplei str. Twist]MCO8182596.1 FHA domain-containing protein [Tropheryma whipplei]CAD67203.1 conserved hypothetical protein [Tropheryma whipplei TW08/27]